MSKTHMKYLGNKTIFLMTVILLACAPAMAKDTRKTAQVKNLVIVVINGVRYEDAFGNKNRLYIDKIWNKLRPLGTICTKFENSESTFPIPAQMSLLTGVWHILENPLNDTLRPVYPTLFEYWNKAHKGQGGSSYFPSNDTSFKSLSCSSHEGFGTAYAPVFDYDTTGANNAVYDKVVPYISKNHPSFIYLSLGTGIGSIGKLSDVFGEPPCKPEKKDECGARLLNTYYESIMLMDAIIYDLWNRLQDDKVYKDKTLFLVMSAHGRHTNEFHGFGDKCEGCRHLFMLAIGPGIKQGFESNRKRTLINICPTVGTVFNVPTPYAKTGVMKELFE